MTEWLTATRLVDIALACIVLEALVLWLLRHRWTKFAHPRGVAANVLSGAVLMVALRIALSGGHWSLIALCLSVSLVAHAADLSHRLAGRT